MNRGTGFQSYSIADFTHRWRITFFRQEVFDIRKNRLLPLCRSMTSFHFNHLDVNKENQSVASIITDMSYLCYKTICGRMFMEHAGYFFRRCFIENVLLQVLLFALFKGPISFYN